MKTAMLVVLLLTGCGPDVLIESARTGSTSTSSRPVDCVASCRAVKPQLLRDFGFTEAQVDCSSAAFAQAVDCPSCQALFSARFGVELTCS